MALTVDARGVERVVGVVLILGVALSPLPFVPLNVFGWFALLPVVLMPALRSRSARAVVLILAAAGAFQLAVDFSLAVPLYHLAKGLARYTGILLSLIGTLWVLERRLLDRNEVALLHGIGWTVGTVLFFVPAPGFGLWKYGLLAPITLVAVALCSQRWVATQRLVWLLALIPVAAVSLFTGTRNTAVVLMLAVLICLVVAWAGQAMSAARIVLISVVFVVGFSLAANAGMLGSSVQEKWEKQGGSPLTVMIVGRPETSFSVGALSTGGLVPHGSGSSASADVFAAGAASVTKLPLDEKNALLDRLRRGEDGLDLHSVVATATWQGGAPCGLAFLAILVLIGARTLRINAARVRTLGPVYVYAPFMLIWDFLFSPWTYYTGASWGVLLAIVFATESDDVASEVRHV
jgi:hypothetical protein